MNILTTFGTAVACCGVLFFLFCAGLVFWYLFNQPQKAASESTQESPVEAGPQSPATSNETPGIDG